jgi:hypothetical protein
LAVIVAVSIFAAIGTGMFASAYIPYPTQDTLSACRQRRTTKLAGSEQGQAWYCNKIINVLYVEGHKFPSAYAISAWDVTCALLVPSFRRQSPLLISLSNQKAHSYFQDRVSLDYDML